MTKVGAVQVGWVQCRNLEHGYEGRERNPIPTPVYAPLIYENPGLA